MLKPFAIILSILLVFGASMYIPSAVESSRLEKLADSVRKDSTEFAARIKILEPALKCFDDTLQMAKSKPSNVDSIYFVSYRYQNTDPHPEIRQRGACPFFIDSIHRTDSTLIIELYGVASGGYPPWGTVCFRNDTLVLIYWEEYTGQPALGAYFKWSLFIEINIDASDAVPVIKLADRDKCLRRREEFVRENGFSRLNKVKAYFHPAIVRARMYHPDLKCSSVGCGVQDSYRSFPDTASLIMNKNPKLVSFNYTFPQFTEEEMRTKTYRMHTGYKIVEKEIEGDLMTITISGNQGSRYIMDGNILIEGDTIFFIQWPSVPEEPWAVAIFKRQLTYTIRIPSKPWHFRNINLTSYVWKNKAWYRQRFPVKEK